jgi:uncharacterized membrane protein
MTLLLDDAHVARPSAAPALPAGFVATTARPRLDSIDLLRGLIMVVMALDHTRDFFGASGMNPRDVADPALFMTRWVTHFCAPIFIFLSGISAWLYGSRGRTAGEPSRFLLTRGLWLVLIEFTVVRLGWSFSLDLDDFVAQVIFAIGASMVVLAGLIHLPRWAIATVALTMIAGHNLLDGLQPEQFGALGWMWNVLHQRGTIEFGPDVDVYVLYPLIPWIGVMAAGYALGPLFQGDADVRRRWLIGLGVSVIAGFVLIRATNLYGDPEQWKLQDSALTTVLSFINCEKYPPSLLYLMMTLGPALLLLAAFERMRGRFADVIATFGRVPFFYYVAHLYLIHVLALIAAWWSTGEVGWLLSGHLPDKPAGYGYGLTGIYAVWLLVVVALYPACRWFAGVKQRNRAWWLSYL